MSTSDNEHSDGEVLLEVERLQIGHGRRVLLPAFDLAVRRGEFWAVIGRNGAGKTTWLRTLLGLLRPQSGGIRKSPGVKLAYLPQRGVADDLYPLTGRDIVAMGCLRDRSFLRMTAEHRRRVERALDLMGVRDLADQSFRELSEGQRQRILFARIAASQADLAVLDEPTSALDLVAERQAFELLQRLRAEAQTAIIIVSHYVSLVAEFADRAILLDRDTPDVVVGTPTSVLRHPSFGANYGESVAPAP
jgi:zinc transport system ATP-binding protein